MNKSYIIATAFVLFLTSCATPIKNRKATDTVNTTEYTCENKKHLEVVYLTTGEGDHQARIQYKKTQYILENIPSGSGVKYSDGKHTWWTKGASGFLEIDNVTILRNCLSQDKNEGNK